LNENFVFVRDGKSFSKFEEIKVLVRDFMSQIIVRNNDPTRPRKEVWFWAYQVFWPIKCRVCGCGVWVGGVRVCVGGEVWWSVDVWGVWECSGVWWSVDVWGVWECGGVWRSVVEWECVRVRECLSGGGSMGLRE
jgi:hypothetical protein